jgi:L-arabinonolactonase
MSAALDVLLDAGNVLGEGIIWCERTQSLYWTDIQRATLYRLAPASGKLEQWSMPERLASFALCEDNGWLLLALASRLAFFRLADGQLQTLHEVEPGMPTRCNDGACDRQGRFVFGTLHEPVTGAKEAVGSFWRLHADLRLEQLALPKVAISNSIAFSPDGATMYFCDSLSRRILQCAYGDTLGAAHLFTELDGATGEPDGSCVDAEGALWNAQWGLGRVVRYARDGSVRDVLPLSARQPTRPALGGAQRDTLYVTSARDGLSAAQLAVDPDAGALFHARVPVRGLPEPRFAGKPTCL